jgi:extracellular factor (EF) 3-hydroxypalmitic acid methyl ester biosynthesis protein
MSAHNGFSHHLATLPAEHLRFIEDIIARCGPEPHEYEVVAHWFDRTAEYVRDGAVSQQAVADFWREVTHAHFSASLQGHVVRRPHGYAGDFEIIDRIYLHHISGDESLRRWDEYFQAQHAPRAVRNRKSYLHDWLRLNLAQSPQHPLHLLNLGSGPARDVREWCEQHGEPQPVHFDCVDMDAKAIAHASDLCAAWPEAVSFTQANVLRLKPKRRYNLIWSAGLFDYLSDRIFVRLVKRLMTSLHSNGELVIGNFGHDNPSRSYMEDFGEWALIHRSEAHLLSLANAAGFDEGTARVEREQEGVNLFLHLKS